MIGAPTIKANFCYEVMEVTGSAPYLDVLTNLLTSASSSSNEEWLHLAHYHLRGVSPQPDFGHLITSCTFTIRADFLYLL